MRSVLVEVTQDDIAGAALGTFYSCPVALAAQRATGRGATVGLWTCSLDNGDEFDLPPEAQAFIGRFDEGEPVGPLSFKMEKSCDQS